jgi:Domain of unknown function (DUF4328)/Protein of unknown function (DUF2510)
MDDAFTSTSSLPPDGPEPGWYLDPWDPARLRWWDGHAWTATSAVRDGARHAAIDASVGAGARDGARVDMAQQLAMSTRAARRAGIALTCAPVLAAIRFSASRAQYRRVADSIRGLEPLTTQDPTGGAAVASQMAGLAGIAVYVVFIVWFYRAAKTARAMMLPSQRSTGWAVGGWLVPIVNLWFPYQSAKGMLPAGDPGIATLRRWWGWWLATYLGTALVIGTATGPRWLFGIGVTVAVMVEAVAAYCARAAIDTIVSTHARLARTS